MLTGQRSLFGGGAAGFDPAFTRLRRVDLGEGAWVEYVPSWVSGHASLFDALATGTRWRSGEREMYERTVEVPRLVAALPSDGPGHPLIPLLRAALDARYGTAFERVSLALYRDGRDSVAWHGDYVARELPQAIVATVSLGEPRKFLLRRTGGGPSRSFSLGWGDLIVMGGTCQRTFQHAIPKTAHASPRIALMFRPMWEKPEKPDKPPGSA